MMQLRPYQVKAVEFCLEKEDALIADEQGLGKSIEVLAYYHCLLHSGVADRCIIVAPAALLTNWSKEIEQYFGFTPSLFTPKQRMVPEAPINLISYDMLRKHHPHYFTHFNLKKTLLVLDEAQKIKNPQGKTYASLSYVKVARRVALTGTPIWNKVEDLYALVRFINPTLAGDYTTWMNQFCIRQLKQVNRYRKAWVIMGYKNLDQLNYMLSQVMIRRKKEEVATELPPKIVQFIPYDARDSLYHSTLDQVAIDDDTVLVKLIRLQQALSGLNPYAKEKFSKSAKFYLLSELMSNSDGRIVVWFQFVETLQNVANQLKDLGYKVFSYHGQNLRFRDEELAKWRKTEGAVLLATIGAGGVGHTWTEASKAIFYEQGLSPSANVQAEDRIHRIGQTNPCEILYLYGVGTVEEAVCKLVSEKKKAADAVVDGFSTDELKRIYDFSYELRV